MKGPKRVYWAAPLFNEEEREFNASGCAALEKVGYDVFLPQRDAGEVSASADEEEIFWKDVEGLKQCDYVVAVLNGRVPDEGTVFEMGYANAMGKPIFGICSDKRKSTNAMFAPVIHCHNVQHAIKEMIRATVTAEAMESISRRMRES
jgi:nucleoside 2-deoxyribosyltransferase